MVLIKPRRCLETKIASENATVPKKALKASYKLAVHYLVKCYDELYIHASCN